MGGFSFIEMHYYQPRMVENIKQNLEKISGIYDTYVDDLLSTFAVYSLDDRTKTFIERDSTDTDIENRQKMTAELMEKNAGVLGVRVVEADGIHVHYSTFPSDILSQEGGYIAYRNYQELGEVDFGCLATFDNGEYASTPKLMTDRAARYYDSERDRLIFSFPYFDKYTAYRGTLLFYVAADDFLRLVIAENLVSLNSRVKVVAPAADGMNVQTSDNTGVVFGMPLVGRSMLEPQIRRLWDAGQYGAEQLVQDEKGALLILVTGKTSRYCNIGWISPNEDFVFSDMEKWLLLTALALTLFLAIFLLFNIRHDDTILIRERIRKFEIALFKEYLERKDTDDWKELEKKVALRKQDVNAEIVKSLGSTGKKHSREITDALDKSWNEFMKIISGSYKASLEQLSSNPVVVSEIEPVEEVEEVPEAESVEELEEVPEAEPVEELEEVPEAEPVEELEEIPEAEPVEELEEIPEAEPVEELEEVPEAESVEELEEVPEAEPVEELEEVPEAESVEELEEVPEAEPVEELEEVPEDESDSTDTAEESPIWMHRRNSAEAARLKSILDNDEFSTPSFSDLDDEDFSKWSSENTN